MSAPTGWRLVVFAAVLLVLSGCATNRILKCEGHLVPINPPPPKPAVATPAPARKPQSARPTERKP
jgi:hypothetical protein